MAHFKPQSGAPIALVMLLELVGYQFVQVSLVRKWKLTFLISNQLGVISTVFVLRFFWHTSVLLRLIGIDENVIQKVFWGTVRNWF